MMFGKDAMPASSWPVGLARGAGSVPSLAFADQRARLETTLPRCQVLQGLLDMVAIVTIVV